MNFTLRNLFAALAAAGTLLASAEDENYQDNWSPASKYNRNPSLIAALCQDFVDDAGEKAVSDFGLGILEGADGLFGFASDDYSEEPPPNPMYPEPLEKDALYFGGTDLGRYIPETLVLNDGVRPDVSVVTQNCLADGNYMAVIRERYGKKCAIPSEDEHRDAFRKFVEGVQSGKIDARDAVTIGDGKATITGTLAVMKLNEILAKHVFEKNKGKHAMYVQESYHVEWMYDYMTPHGLVTKLNAEKSGAVSKAEVRESAEFWDWMTKRLISNKEFAQRRAESCRKGADGKMDSNHRLVVRDFSKLRLTHAKLYSRAKNGAAFAEAIRQAVAIDPLEPETGWYYSWLLKASKLNAGRDDYRGYTEKFGGSTAGWR
ncbi:MAG: hypothetical protein K6G91_01820 [Kiritimatiellae bacterium]|nr:hypothetical protein [Kiritimatiellia bacterium]